MINSFMLAPTVTAVVGVAFGAAFYRNWEFRAAKRKRRVPEQWQLQARPLFTDVEHTVWHWLKSAFFDHYVLVKIPVIRFLSPRSIAEGQHSHELLKGIYCSFTVCASDGTVIGCIDVPGPSGLRASQRDMKQKLFAECGIAYAVVSAAALPAREVVRDVFLGEFEIPDEPHESYQHPYSRNGNAGDPDAESPDTVPDSLRAHDETADQTPGEIDMLAVAAARNSLQAKLERNRKTRIANIEKLSASLGIIEDNADHDFSVQWEDSFIMGEESEVSGGGKR
jgi:hypothetical protein